MPLEIGEIGITMRVADDEAGKPRGEGGDSCATEQQREEREDMIDECVRRVLRALRTERER